MRELGPPTLALTCEHECKAYTKGGDETSLLVTNRQGFIQNFDFGGVLPQRGGWGVDTGVV